MYQPSAVWLATDYAGDRWLTDQFVVYNITGIDALYCYDSSYDVQWPDGPYKLVQAKGFRELRQRDSIPQPDIEGYLKLMGERNWQLAEPTEWSVAEHPGKAMLWLAGGPCLLGESTWTAIRKHYPGVVVEWAPNKGAGVFRFSIAVHIDPDDDCAAGQCGCEAVPFGYAAGIRCPEGQEGIADAIVGAMTTSNEEVE